MSTLTSSPRSTAHPSKFRTCSANSECFTWQTFNVAKCAEVFLFLSFTYDVCFGTKLGFASSRQLLVLVPFFVSRTFCCCYLHRPRNWYRCANHPVVIHRVISSFCDEILLRLQKCLTFCFQTHFATQTRNVSACCARRGKL